MNKKYWIIGGSIIIVILLFFVFVAYAVKQNRIKKGPFRPTISGIAKQKIAIIYHPYNKTIIQVADLIRSKVGGTVYLIEPKKPYPTRITDHARIKIEQNNPANVNLKKNDLDVKSYHILFLGLPVIDNNMSPVMMKFLLSNADNFKSDQIIIPFTFCEGKDNTMKSDEFLFQHTPRITKKNGFITSISDIAGNDMNINIWLNDMSFYRYELK